MPALDGSARLFAAAILEAGLRPLDNAYPELELSAPVRVEQGESFVEACPGDFRIEYSIDFPEKAIGTQSFLYTGGDYLSLIAPARTFGRLKDVEMMRSMGLSLGGSLANAVVVDEDKILNAEGLRFADEFVRHKILDLIGDLWTLGASLKADIRAHKANHRLHIELVRKLLPLVRP
ncbi:MAG: UDP-3-O-(3-hydroxymyristoyl) N-acetylglucosamine deacetylase [Deltaproteobacteria bacterium ADurb.Bin510]|nr:MAG: UDP-3-O-(3-hydroxymyristoyl) N-acetylglucosamine deacetylase [Deltaproteobacteria bacterium ADurb.Bin510]